jgi:hypothetical protein
MATSTITTLPVLATVPSRSDTHQCAQRRFTLKSRRALKILGHAIEYLTHEQMDRSGNKGQLEAVRLLMALNHQVYFECPEMPAVGAQIKAFLRIDPA